MASNAGRLLDMTLTAPYAAAKGGVIQFTRHVALELGRHGIRVNSIAPATVLSERVERIMDPEKRDRVAKMSPLGRLGTPEDCALATLFLVSDSASWLTGVTLDVAGGRVML
jgi:3-oxoacyl-[acyl-carrier protein] reductase